MLSPSSMLSTRYSTPFSSLGNRLIDADSVSQQALERPDIAPNVRTKYLKPLYRTCAGHGLLPRSLQIELVDGLTGDALYHGGFGDVWKCEHRGQQVAVKVLRISAKDDRRKTTRVNH